MTELHHQLQPNMAPTTEPIARTGEIGHEHAWLSAAIKSLDRTTAIAAKQEDLPTAVLQQLRYRAQCSGMQQQQQRPPVTPLVAPHNGAELDLGLSLAALNEQQPADGDVPRHHSRAAKNGSLAAVTVQTDAAALSAAQPGDAAQRAPSTTGVFAKRAKRKADANGRRAQKAARPDGAGDLSFFMQLRKPRDGAAAETAEPEPTDSGLEDSTDVSAGADSGTQQQPEVTPCSLSVLWCLSQLRSQRCICSVALTD